MSFVKKYWFLMGLVFLFLFTVTEQGQALAVLGVLLKSYYGAEICIFIIFVFSGMIIDADQIRAGIMDFQGTLLTLAVIFIIAPIISALFGLFIFDIQLLVGLYLIGAMPTTLNSGVVMTGTAGGNLAHALFITIIASMLSVLTIPITLELLLGQGLSVQIEKMAMMIKLLIIIVLPLLLGIKANRHFWQQIKPYIGKIQLVNQLLILVIIWMALSQSKSSPISSHSQLIIIILISVLFHGILLAAAFGGTVLFKIGHGRRESVLFMGGQKTLTLAIIIQADIFPHYGLTLAVCVIHHIVHLMMDGYLAIRLGDKPVPQQSRHTPTKPNG